jgi:Holliday junction DNA helicase RuvA
MIGYLEGTVIGRHHNAVILRTAGGVGYTVHLPLPLLARALETKGALTLHVVTIVRDDAISLYGFDEPAARDTFEQLIQVSGVGPKVAIAILSAFTAANLADALARQDVAALSSVPGIGKKTASRLCMELSDRMARHQLQGGGPAGARADLISALTNMGFPEKDVLHILQQFPKDEMPFEEQVRIALGLLART